MLIKKFEQESNPFFSHHKRRATINEFEPVSVIYICLRRRDFESRRRFVRNYILILQEAPMPRAFTDTWLNFVSSTFHNPLRLFNNALAASSATKQQDQHQQNKSNNQSQHKQIRADFRTILIIMLLIIGNIIRQLR